MRVTHVVPVTPKRCGMYETARELVVAERAAGVDAWLYDPRPPKPGPDPKGEGGTPPWTEDRGACVAPLHWALGSDVIVSHSGLDERFDASPAPRVHVAHGRPNSSYRIEAGGETPIYSMYSRFAKDPRWKLMVTLWKGYEDYWRLLFPRVASVPAWVDLDHWRPGPVDGYWGEKAGRPNVLICDLWRMDKDPFYPLHACALLARALPRMRVHVLGCGPNPKGRGAILDGLARLGVLGQVAGMLPDLRPAYMSADVMITPHRIATRTVREALASGCQVVAAAGNPYTPYTADPEDLPTYAAQVLHAWDDLRENRPVRRAANRAVAEKEFDLGRAAGAFLNLLETVKGAV